MTTQAEINANPSVEALDGRVQRLREYMSTEGLDAFLVTQPANRRYITGFSGHDSPPIDTAGMVVISKERVILITDSRYTIWASEQAKGAEIVQRRMGITTVGQTGEVLRDLGVKRVGFEGFSLIYAFYEDLRQAAPDAELVSTRGVIDRLRRQKDADEMALLRRAIAISDQAFDEVSAAIEPGMTELEIARRIEERMVELGAEGPAFSTAVASGPNGAMAHSITGERKVQEGEPIVIDMGASLYGYNSDMTRTIILGEPDARFKEIYNIVLKAHLNCEEKVHSGMSGDDGDALCRDIIEAAGYGDNFGHGTGHGIGLEVHEGPQMRRVSQDAALDNGAVVSVEPGIYIEGWGGVRIEDLVLLGPDGAEVLTKARKHGYYSD